MDLADTPKAPDGDRRLAAVVLAWTSNHYVGWSCAGKSKNNERGLQPKRCQSPVFWPRL